jgi:hypothetical protein
MLKNIAHKMDVSIIRIKEIIASLFFSYSVKAIALTIMLILYVTKYKDIKIARNNKINFIFLTFFKEIMRFY